MFKIKNLFKAGSLYYKDHAPEILTGIGIGGMFTTIVLAVKATPECVEEIKEKQATGWAMFKIGCKHYAWAIGTGTLSTVCLVCSTVKAKRKNTALAAALALSENDLLEHKEKVKELLGDKQAEEIERSIVEDHAQNVEIDEKHMIHTGTGAMLTLDLVTGQIFYSDRDWIDRKFIELNEYIQIHEELTVTDYAYIMHLENPELIGDIIGWKYDSKRRAGEQILLHPTYVGYKGCGEPMFVIGHIIPPKSLV